MADGNGEETIGALDQEEATTWRESLDGQVVELEEEDCAPTNVARGPGRPSAEDVEEHRVDHYPYRCWCEHCVIFLA